jgi:hypothetical protein
LLTSSNGPEDSDDVQDPLTTNLDLDVRLGHEVVEPSRVLRRAGKADARSQWVNALVARRGVNRAIVAVANKNARIIWVLLARQQDYRRAA